MTLQVTLALIQPLTVGVLLHWASLPAAAVCVLLRFRASRGVERQQMRWVAAGAAGAVAGLLLAVPGGLELLPSDLGNMAVAGATWPLRRRVQDRVDRRFNRRRYDGARTIEAFSTRPRRQIDLDNLIVELVAVVDQTMQPTRVAVWLRPTRARAWRGRRRLSPSTGLRGAAAGALPGSTAAGGQDLP